MAFVVRLRKNLKKTILQGDPWLYKEALSQLDHTDKALLCKVVGSKNEFICWGLYSPESSLAVRVLSVQKQQPNQRYFEQMLCAAVQLRKFLFDDHQSTNCFRLINGEGDYLPGIICDVYADVAVIQFDGKGPYEFWDQEWLALWILKNTPCQSVYLKPRSDLKVNAFFWGKSLSEESIQVIENHCVFEVNFVSGQKTGFFLDQRENRNYIKLISKNRTVLNLFSYTGGFSVYSGVGGAKQVVSVDVSQEALNLAKINWDLNHLNPSAHKMECVDIFKYDFQNNKLFDIVVCDPPSLARSEKHKEGAILKYIELFSAAAKCVDERGHLVLSSCSSHINFDDFFKIIQHSLSKSRKRGQVFRVSGQGADHPYPHVCPHLRYLKFVDLVIFS